jgi:hypothetical protein
MDDNDRLLFAVILFSFWYLNKLFLFVPDFFRFYQNFLEYCTRYYYEYDEEDEYDEKKQHQLTVTKEETNQTSNSVVRFENKYMEYTRKLNKEWVLTEEEAEKCENLAEQIYKEKYNNKLEEIQEMETRIDLLEKQIKKNDAFTDSEPGLINTWETDEIKELTKLLSTLSKLKQYISLEEKLNTMKENAKQLALKEIIRLCKLEKLTNCYVMENTPNGNVLMTYEVDSENFCYYSDFSIPYRYLEVVARKYIKQFNCRPIFIDMEEELVLFEEKWNAQQEMSLKKEIIVEKTEQKKNVFAKFKSYNKNLGINSSMVGPPKNSIPNKSLQKKKEYEKTLLKERANRYKYAGKMCNFQFLKNVNKSVFNKKLAITFADFKRLKR